MATELLAIPEEEMADFIRVLRAGLNSVEDVPAVMKEDLLQWCEDEEEYLLLAAREETIVGGTCNE